MTDHEEVSKGDTQILHETVFNERIVTHPKLGQIKLRLPNLEIQRKIDAVGRAKKKFLKEAKDTVTDENGTVTRVPAYKSREQLSREYEELGWWTDVERTRLTELQERHIQLLTELELLNFDSDIAIYTNVKNIYLKLLDFCKNDSGDISKEVLEALNSLTTPGAIIKPSDVSVIKDNSSTTEVDDLIEQLQIYSKQYNTYIQLAKIYTELVALQSQQAQLFSDSWQEQLQYFLRLAQVFYCTELLEAKKPIWANLEAIEAEQDVELIRWVFGELNAFWQGISDETRERMSKYSFMSPRNTELSPSEDSPVPQEPSQDGEPQEKPQINSTLVTDTQEPLVTAKSS